MDLSYKRFMRRVAAEYVSAAEIISRRKRAGACIMCGSLGQDKCDCVGMYLYKDENDSYRLRRNKRSTLPFAIVTNILPLKGVLEVLELSPIKARAQRGGTNTARDACYLTTKEIEVSLDQIIDLDTAVRLGVDIEESEKRVLTHYLTALEHASDLGAIVDE